MEEIGKIDEIFFTVLNNIRAESISCSLGNNQILVTNHDNLKKLIKQNPSLHGISLRNTRIDEMGSQLLVEHFKGDPFL